MVTRTHCQKKRPVSFETEQHNRQECHRNKDHLRVRAVDDDVSKKKSEENTLLDDVDDDESEPEPEHVQSDSFEPGANGGECQHYPSRIWRPPNCYRQ